MEMNDWIQFALLIVTIATVIVGWISTSRSIRAGARSATAQRVLELGGDLNNCVGMFRADILPFWRSGDSRAKYAGIPQEVQVHRDLEKIRAVGLLLRNYLTATEQKDGCENELANASDLLGEACMTLYLVLVQERSTIKSPQEYFVRQFEEGSAHWKVAGRLISEIRLTGHPGRANAADAVVAKVVSHFLMLLAEYARDASLHRSK